MGVFDGVLKVLKALRKLLAPLEFVGKKVAIAVNYILLTLVYFTAFAATAIVAKALRKSFLDLEIDKSAKTYWMDRKKEDYSKKDSYRSF